jgi:hypothetical protein
MDVHALVCSRVCTRIICIDFKASTDKHKHVHVYNEKKTGLRFTPTHVHDSSGGGARGEGEGLTGEEEAQVRKLFRQVNRKGKVGLPMGLVGTVEGGREGWGEAGQGGGRGGVAQETGVLGGLPTQQEVDMLFQQAP